VQEKIAARQMTPIPPNLFNEILERLRETQVIVGTMSQAAQLITLEGSLLQYIKRFLGKQLIAIYKELSRGQLLGK
jgi:hypothetical protein